MFRSVLTLLSTYPTEPYSYRQHSDVQISTSAALGLRFRVSTRSNIRILPLDSHILPVADI